MFMAVMHVRPMGVTMRFRGMMMPMTMVVCFKIFGMGMSVMLIIMTVVVVMVHDFMDMVVAMLIAKEDNK
jgi:hypothetical protein